MKQLLWMTALICFFSGACTNPNSSGNKDKINLRLKWAYQAQFSGYMVAKEMGFYKEAGLDVDIKPAGPDLKPYATVATGVDDVGIGIISQIITSRSNGVPLVAIAQIFQDSPNRFVLKGKNRIDSLPQLKGKKVGLWLGGDEIEFVSMLKKVGMELKDITVIPQKFSVSPFIADEYVCSQVMIYNEQLQVQKELASKDSLQVFSPKDFNSAILGDLLFTSETFLKKHPERLERFLAATFKGWQYVKEHPDEAVNIVLKYNPELNKEEQMKQLNAILGLIYTGNTVPRGMGYLPVEDYENAKAILLNGLPPGSSDYTKIKSTAINTVFTSAVWDKVKPEQKAGK